GVLIEGLAWALHLAWGWDLTLGRVMALGLSGILFPLAHWEGLYFWKDGQLEFKERKDFKGRDFWKALAKLSGTGLVIRIAALLPLFTPLIPSDLPSTVTLLSLNLPSTVMIAIVSMGTVILTAGILHSLYSTRFARRFTSFPAGMVGGKGKDTKETILTHWLNEFRFSNRYLSDEEFDAISSGVTKLFKSPKVTKDNAKDVLEKAGDVARLIKWAGGGVPEIEAVFSAITELFKSPKVTEGNAKDVLKKAGDVAAWIKQAGGGVKDILTALIHSGPYITDIEVAKLYVLTFKSCIKEFLSVQKSSLNDYNRGTKFAQFCHQIGLLIMSLGKPSDLLIQSSIDGYASLIDHPIIQALTQNQIQLTPWMVNKLSESQDANETIQQWIRAIQGLDLKKLSFEALERETNPERLSLIYNALWHKYGLLMEGVPFEDFHKSSIVKMILDQLNGKEPYLSERDIREIVDMSMDLDQEIREYATLYHADDPFWITSVRDLIKLHREFIHRYLSDLSVGEDETIAAKDVMGKFVMTVYTVYGGLFGEEKNWLENILERFMREHRDLFIKLALGDRESGENLKERLHQYWMRSFEAERTDSNRFYQVESYEAMYWSLKRACEMGEASLVVEADGSADSVKVALAELAQESGGTAYRASLSGYSDRAELFGMDLPDEAGQMKPCEGILPRLITQADSNGGKPIYLVLDNIEAAEGSLRVEFNPILWEKELFIAKTGVRYRIPKNLHIIFTMAEGGKLEDEAFLNRVIKHKAGELSEKDMEAMLKNKINLEETSAKKLSQFYTQIQHQEWQQSSFRMYPQDLINIALTAKSRCAENPQLEPSPILAEELYRYMILRFRFEKDRRNFREVFQNLFYPGSEVPDPYETSELRIGGSQLIADGVPVKIGNEFLGYAAGHSQERVEEMILNLYGYVLREQDKRLIGQWVRQIYVRGSGSREESLFTVLEGASGEGKTELAQVLGKILGYGVTGYTAHRKTLLEEFRGGLEPGLEGMQVVNDTPYLEAERSGGHVIHTSELNTVQRQALGYWLTPIARNDERRQMPEIAKIDPAGDPFYTNTISPDNLYIADINPDDFRARGPLPLALTRNSKNFWVGYDYGEEDPLYQDKIKSELERLMAQLFKVHDPELDDERRALFSKKLAQLYYDLQKALQTGKTTSFYQVLTIRDAIRTIKLTRHLREKGESIGEAYQRAALITLWGMWMEIEVRQGLSPIFAKHQINTQNYSNENAFDLILDARLGPILIQGSDAADGLELLKRHIEKKNEKVQRHYITASEFTELEGMTGGVSVGETGEIRNYAGTVLKIVELAQASSEQTQYLVIDNLQQMNADTAVGLNRALQEGRLELTPALARQYAENPLLEEGRYLRLPKNFRIVGLIYTPREPSLNDKLPMSAAELSRYSGVHLTSEICDAWIRHYIAEHLPEGTLQDSAIEYALKIWERYGQEIEDGHYRHTRLSWRDFEEYVNTLKKASEGETLSAEKMKRIAYNTLGIGLRDEYRQDLIPEAIEEIKYIEHEGVIYLKINGTQYPTEYQSLEAAQKNKYLAEVQENISAMEALLMGFANDRNVILLEGPPGGGKTALAEDLARRLNLKFRKLSMYRDIDLGELIGKLEQRNERWILTATRDDQNKFLTEFLDYIEKGGVFCLDEGNISHQAIQLMGFLMQIIRSETLDLGLYHQGIPIQRTVKIHPLFKVIATYNPSDITQSRQELPLSLEQNAKKIWITDQWSQASYERLIRYYSGEGTRSLEPQINPLINLHIAMKWIMDETFRKTYRGPLLDEVKQFKLSEFNELYTYQYGVSPRELIRIASLIEQGGNLYEGILLNYIYQFNEEDAKGAIEIVEKFFPGFKNYIQEWQNDTKIIDGGTHVDIGNVRLPKYVSSVQEREDAPYFVPVKSQMGALKALARSTGQQSDTQPIHSLLIAEQGSDPLDLVKELGRVTGMEIAVFDGTSFTSSTELVGERGLKQGPMDENGLAVGTDEEATLLGFLGEHLVEEGKPPSQGEPDKILYLSSLELLRDEELERLNDFLNTGEIRIEQKNYRLPSHIHIVASTASTRTKQFSSPFYNRFQKIALSAVTEEDEMESYLDRYHEGLTEEEKTLIVQSSKLAWYLDMGLHDLHLNIERQKLNTRYGYSVKDARHLAELVLWDKKRQMTSGVTEIDSVRTVLCNILRLYGQGMNEVGKPSDRSIYLERLITEVFRYEGINAQTIQALENELRDVKRKTVTIPITKSELENGKTFANGIQIQKTQSGYTIQTPFNRYLYQGGEMELSGGLKVREDADHLTLELSLIESIGGMPLLPNETALPPEEVPKMDYLKHYGVINEVMESVMWATRRIRDTQGRIILPRPIVLMGETGGSKSTLVRNLGAITGIPVHTLTAYKGMEPDSIIARMEAGQGRGSQRQLSLQMKGFFSQLGKINGQYYNAEGMTSHTQRKILFIDEANTAPEIMHCLRPLFEGRRQFTYYLAGARFEVELDPEVILILAGNPAGTYEGRSTFSPDLLESAHKIWVPVLHRYLESPRVKREDLAEILMGLHTRRMKELDRSESFAQVRTAMTYHSDNALPIEELKPASSGEMTYKTYPRLEGTVERTIQKSEKERAPPIKIKKDLNFKYSLSKIRTELDRIQTLSSPLQKYQHFLDHVLRDYLLALSAGTMDESLQQEIETLTQGLDFALEAWTKNLHALFKGEKVSETGIELAMNQLRSIVLKNESLKRFIFSFALEKENKLYLLIHSEPILETLALEESDLQKLGINAEKYKAQLPLHAYLVEKHPFAEEEAARGVFKGGDYVLAYKSALSGMNEKSAFSQVGSHELGHFIDQMRLHGEEVIKLHDNIELFSMLFPLIFGLNPKEYLKNELARQLQTDKDEKSYYSQAAKGILNGYLRMLKRENAEDDQLKRIEEITDLFEDDRAQAILNAIERLKLNDETVRNIAIAMYQEAWKKKFQGDYDLSSAKGGRYKMAGGRGTGNSIHEIADGLAQGPNVEMEDLDEASGRQIEQNIEIEEESGSEGHAKEIEHDKEGKATGGKPGESKGEAPSAGRRQIVSGDWLEEYGKRLGGFAKRLMALFASEPQGEDVYKRSGIGKIDMRRWQLGMSRVIKSTAYEDAEPELWMGITVDGSGSITMRDNLVRSFTELTKFFSALMRKAGQGHRSVGHALGVIGEDYHPVFGFNETGDVEKVRTGPNRMWNMQDGGGINTLHLIEGLKQKYADKKKQKNKVEIVFTDGGERAFGDPPTPEQWRQLEKKVENFEKEYGVNMIFVGIGTEDVKHYRRFVLFDTEPNEDEMKDVVTRLGLLKMTRPTLPLGDLGRHLGIKPPPSTDSARSLPAGLNPLVRGTVHAANLSSRMPSQGRALGLMPWFYRLLDRFGVPDEQKAKWSGVEEIGFTGVLIEGLAWALHLAWGWDLTLGRVMGLGLSGILFPLAHGEGFYFWENGKFEFKKRQALGRDFWKALRKLSGAGLVIRLVALLSMVAISLIWSLPVIVSSTLVILTAGILHSLYSTWFARKFEWPAGMVGAQSQSETATAISQMLDQNLERAEYFFHGLNETIKKLDYFFFAPDSARFLLQGDFFEGHEKDRERVLRSLMQSAQFARGNYIFNILECLKLMMDKGWVSADILRKELPIDQWMRNISRYLIGFEGETPIKSLRLLIEMGLVDEKFKGAMDKIASTAIPYLREGRKGEDVLNALKVLALLVDTEWIPRKKVVGKISLPHWLSSLQHHNYNETSILKYLEILIRSRWISKKKVLAYDLMNVLGDRISVGRNAQLCASVLKALKETGQYEEEIRSLDPQKLWNNIARLLINKDLKILYEETAEMIGILVEVGVWNARFVEKHLPLDNLFSNLEPYEIHYSRKSFSSNAIALGILIEKGALGGEVLERKNGFRRFVGLVKSDIDSSVRSKVIRSLEVMVSKGFVTREEVDDDFLSLVKRGLTDQDLEMRVAWARLVETLVSHHDAVTSYFHDQIMLSRLLTDFSEPLKPENTEVLSRLKSAGIFSLEEILGNPDQCYRMMRQESLTLSQRARIVKIRSMDQGKVDRTDVAYLCGEMKRWKRPDDDFKKALKIMCWLTHAGFNDAQSYLSGVAQSVLSRVSKRDQLYVDVGDQERLIILAILGSHSLSALYPFIYQSNIDPGLRIEVIGGLARAGILDEAYLNIKEDSLPILTAAHQELGSIVPPWILLEKVSNASMTIAEIKEGQQKLTALDALRDYRVMVRALVQDEHLMLAYYCLRPSPFSYSGVSPISYDRFKAIIQKASQSLDLEDTSVVNVTLRSAFVKAGVPEMDARQMMDFLLKGRPSLPTNSAFLDGEGRFIPQRIDSLISQDQGQEGMREQAQKSFQTSSANLSNLLKLSSMIRFISKELARLEKQGSEGISQRKEEVEAIVSQAHQVGDQGMFEKIRDFDERLFQGGLLIKWNKDAAKSWGYFFRDNPHYKAFFQNKKDSLDLKNKETWLENWDILSAKRGIETVIRALEHRAQRKGITPEEALRTFLSDLAKKFGMDERVLKASFDETAGDLIASFSNFSSQTSVAQEISSVVYLDYVDKRDLFEILRFSDGAHCCNTSDPKVGNAFGNGIYDRNAHRWITDATTFFFQMSTESRGGKQVGWLKCWFGIDQNGLPFVGSNFIYLAPGYQSQGLQQALLKQVENVLFSMGLSMVAQADPQHIPANSLKSPSDYEPRSVERFIRLQSLKDGEPIQTDRRFPGNQTTSGNFFVKDNPNFGSHALEIKETSSDSENPLGLTRFFYRLLDRFGVPDEKKAKWSGGEEIGFTGILMEGLAWLLHLTLGLDLMSGRAIGLALGAILFPLAHGEGLYFWNDEGTPQSILDKSKLYEFIRRYLPEPAANVVLSAVDQWEEVVFRGLTLAGIGALMVGVFSISSLAPALVLPGGILAIALMPLVIEYQARKFADTHYGAWVKHQGVIAREPELAEGGRGNLTQDVILSKANVEYRAHLNFGRAMGWFAAVPFIIGALIVLVPAQTITAAIVADLALIGLFSLIAPIGIHFINNLLVRFDLVQYLPARLQQLIQLQSIAGGGNDFVKELNQIGETLPANLHNDWHRRLKEFLASKGIKFDYDDLFSEFIAIENPDNVDLSQVVREFFESYLHPQDAGKFLGQDEFSRIGELPESVSFAPLHEKDHSQDAVSMLVNHGIQFEDLRLNDGNALLPYHSTRFSVSEELIQQLKDSGVIASDQELMTLIKKGLEARDISLKNPPVQWPPVVTLVSLDQSNELFERRGDAIGINRIFFEKLAQNHSKKKEILQILLGVGITHSMLQELFEARELAIQDVKAVLHILPEGVLIEHILETLETVIDTKNSLFFFELLRAAQKNFVSPYTEKPSSFSPDLLGRANNSILDYQGVARKIFDSLPELQNHGFVRFYYPAAGEDLSLILVAKALGIPSQHVYVSEDADWPYGLIEKMKYLERSGFIQDLEIPFVTERSFLLYESTQWRGLIYTLNDGTEKVFYKHQDIGSEGGGVLEYLDRMSGERIRLPYSAKRSILRERPQDSVKSLIRFKMDGITHAIIYYIGDAHDTDATAEKYLSRGMDVFWSTSFSFQPHKCFYQGPVKAQKVCEDGSRVLFISDVPLDRYTEFDPGAYDLKMERLTNDNLRIGNTILNPGFFYRFEKEYNDKGPVSLSAPDEDQVMTLQVVDGASGSARTLGEEGSGGTEFITALFLAAGAAIALLASHQAGAVELSRGVLGLFGSSNMIWGAVLGTFALLGIYAFWQSLPDSPRNKIRSLMRLKETGEVSLMTPTNTVGNGGWHRVRSRLLMLPLFSGIALGGLMVNTGIKGMDGRGSLSQEQQITEELVGRGFGDKQVEMIVKEQALLVRRVKPSLSPEEIHHLHNVFPLTVLNLLFHGSSFLYAMVCSVLLMVAGVFGLVETKRRLWAIFEVVIFSLGVSLFLVMLLQEAMRLPTIAVGFTDPVGKEIFFQVELLDEATIVHETAHILFPEADHEVIEAMGLVRTKEVFFDQ
ncbi:MAG: AAA family ATPase, partial [Chlamydiae bacterium]|nr:AAA family ATPase [Chlamydiota bacterium]